MFNSFSLTTLVLQKLRMGSQGIRIENCAIPYLYSSLFLTLCRCMAGWLMLNPDILSKWMGRLSSEIVDPPCLWCSKRYSLVLYLNVHVVFVVRNMAEADYANTFSFPGQDYVTVCSSLVRCSPGLVPTPFQRCVFLLISEWTWGSATLVTDCLSVQCRN